MTRLTDANFKDFVANGERIIICTAGYCKPCQNAIRQLEDISGIGLVELTDHRCYNTMRRLMVKKVPTVIFYENGEETNRTVGISSVLDMTRRESH